MLLFVLSIIALFAASTLAGWNAGLAASRRPKRCLAAQKPRCTRGGRA